MAQNYYESFKKKLEEIFMMDHAELDFGIYRIMNQKRNDIQRFLNLELLPQVKQVLEGNSGGEANKAKKRMAEIAVLRAHIVNYARTRPVYDAYRKAGYSKKFLEAHREEITIHKAAKAACDELGVRRLPRVKDLSIEYAEVLAAKKQTYAEYRLAKNDAQELLIAQQNIASLYDAERKEEEQKRWKDEQSH